MCTMQGWQEDRTPAYIAGRNPCFDDPQAVAKLLDPEAYARVWTSAPVDELRASAVKLQLPSGRGTTKADSVPVRNTLLLHKRCITQAMQEGREKANLCHDCYRCLTKPKPEMPVYALANGRWLGRHAEIMRSMPYGHRLLLPIRRVILTRVVFTSNPKSEWERSHSQPGLNGVTVVVEQASGAARILEYPPKDLG